MFNRFTASQKRGALILLAILVSILGWRWRVAQLEKDKPLPPETEMAAGEKKTPDSYQDSKEVGGTSNRSPRKQILVELNSADTTELKTVRGIGSVFANRIVKYRKLIGGYHSKDELLEVYGITPERYEGIAPQVWVDADAFGDAGFHQRKSPDAVVVTANPDSSDFGDEEIEERGSKEEETEVAKTNESIALKELVDLNRADSLELVAVKGIGAKTASNIIKYRRLIFFFHSTEQLSEVWGVREKNLEMILPQVTTGADYSGLPHLKVNEMDVKQLASHYYFGYKEAKLLVAYRDQHGAFTSVDDLRKMQGISTKFWERLKPYLEF